LLICLWAVLRGATGRYRWLRVSFVGLTLLLVILAHYTVGAFGLLFLSVLAVSRRDWVLFIPVIVGLLVGVLYYSWAANGILFRGWERLATEPPPPDPIYRLITFDFPNTMSVLDWTAAAVFYFVALFFLLSLAWGTLRTLRLSGSQNLLAYCGMSLVPAALFIPGAAAILYVGRWLQLGSIVFCPVVAEGAAKARTSLIVTVYALYVAYTSGLMAVLLSFWQVSSFFLPLPNYIFNTWR